MEAIPFYFSATYYLDKHYAKERIFSLELEVCFFHLPCDCGHFLIILKFSIFTYQDRLIVLLGDFVRIFVLFSTSALRSWEPSKVLINGIMNEDVLGAQIYMC